MSMSHCCELLTTLDKLSDFISFLWCLCQVLAATLGDKKIVCVLLAFSLTASEVLELTLDPHTTNTPVLFEYLLVDVLLLLLVF